MTTIRYPDDDSVSEITRHFLPTLPAESLPVLLGFRFDGETIHSECAEVYLDGDRGPREPNPIHTAAARIRAVLGAGMFGFGFVFPVFADQLDSHAANRHIPRPVRTAAARLGVPSDVIVAATIDATGRQWWAVLPRHLPGLAPVLLRIPAVAPRDWQLPDSLHASLWTAALALDTANHPHLMRLRTAHSVERQP
ncbi:hypothetical protein [Nocardia sp. NPDC003345]